MKEQKLRDIGLADHNRAGLLRKEVRRDREFRGHSVAPALEAKTHRGPRGGEGLLDGDRHAQKRGHGLLSSASLIRLAGFSLSLFEKWMHNRVNLGIPALNPCGMGIHQIASAQLTNVKVTEHFGCGQGTNLV